MAALSLPTTGPVALVLSKLGGIEKDGPQWKAKCPTHADGTASLGVREGRDGRALLKCRAGCEPETVVRALGLSMTDLFADAGKGAPSRPDAIVTPTLAQATKTRSVMVKSYDYHDADGALVFQVCRMEPKSFRQRRPDPTKPGEWIWKLGDDVPRLLYRLPDVLAAAGDGKRVFVVEGEKDADTLIECGYPATTSVGGAGAWRDAYAESLKGAEVVVLPDNDEAGADYAQAVAVGCHAVGCEVKVVRLPGARPKGDVTDWLDDGHTLDELETAIAATLRWFPPEAPRRYWRLRELLDNESIMRPPPPVVPRLAWAARSTLLAARDKAGKSTLLGAITAAVTRGGTFLDDPCETGDVLLVGLEEFIGDPARRLRSFNADPDRVYLVDSLAGDPRERPRVLAELVDEIMPALVIVDTLAAWGDGWVEDENKASEMAPVTQGLSRIAHRNGCALIIAHHTTKDGGYRGSTGIGGGVDIQIEMMIPDEGGDPTLRKFKCKGRVPVYDFQARYLHGSYMLAGDRTMPLDDRIIQFVRDVSPGASMNDVRRGVGGNAAAVDQAVRLMLERGQLVNGAIPGKSQHALHVPAPATSVTRPTTAPSPASGQNGNDWWNR